MKLLPTITLFYSAEHGLFLISCAQFQYNAIPRRAFLTLLERDSLASLRWKTTQATGVNSCAVHGMKQITTCTCNTSIAMRYL